MTEAEEKSTDQADFRYRFGDFVLDIERGSLLKNGNIVPLRPKTFEVLCYLVEHHGTLISRQQLHDAIWPNAVVSDESLTQCLAEIRKALDDSAREIIRTVPRRGYLFDGPVSKESRDKSQEQSGTPDRGLHPAATFKDKPLLWGTLGLLVVVVAFLAIDRWVLNPGLNTNGLESATPTGTTQDLELDNSTVAVLPFINRSSKEEDEYFTGGMHDELLTRLSHISALKVISRTSVMRYQDTQMSIPEIARELKVGTIIEGGVQRSANQVRINVQVIDAATDEHIWSEIFDRELNAQNLFAMQSEITTAIANALDATLSATEESRVYALPTQDMGAYQHFLRGRQLMSLKTRKDLEQAFSEFNSATELDPYFTLAWVGIADVVGELIWIGALEWDEDLVIREQAVEKALALNDQLGEVHAARASLYVAKSEGDKAEASFLRAIELSPNYARAYEHYAATLRGWDRREQRLQMLSKAAELDPLSLSIQLNLARALGRVGRSEEARQVVYASLEREPEFASGYQFLAHSDSNDGHLAQAIMNFHKALELDPGNGPLMGATAMQYLALGDFDAVDDIRADMVRHLGEDNTQVVLIDHEILQARATFEEAIDRMENLPKNAMSWHTTPWRQTFLYWSAEQYDKALESLLEWQPNIFDREAWEKGAGGTLGFNCIYAAILIAAGEEDVGNELLQVVINNIEAVPEEDRMDRASPRSMAQCYLLAGDHDLGLDILEAGLPGHDLLWTWYYWRYWPTFKQMEGIPRYDGLVESINSMLATERALLLEVKN